MFRLLPVGGRKVIVATNITESSVTINSIVFVVDILRSKGIVYDPRLDISYLVEDIIPRSLVK